MQQQIPKIVFDQYTRLQIEVMDFADLFSRLTAAKDHDPFAPHKIQFYLVLVVTKGKYTHHVDFSDYQIKAGNALFVALDQVQYFSQGLVEAKGYGIVFSAKFIHQHYFLAENFQLNRLFNYHIESPLIQASDLGLDNFAGLAWKLHQEYHFPDPFGKADILAAILRVLLLKAERTKATQSATNVRADWLNRFAQFKNQLEKDYPQTRSARDYAAKLFISYKLLNEIVKKLTGKTAKNFIDEFVTMEIKRYLIATTLSVKEISYRVGFEEPANMVRFFKKNAQVTPLKFRQQQY